MDRFKRAGEAFSELCRVMARLRGPGGCPWDQVQTLDTLRQYLIEEAYEALEALSNDDNDAACEELGDLLLQIVFQAEIAQESGDFDISGIISKITTKLITRHPHVFGSVSAENASEALKSWETVKAKEKTAQASPTSRLDGIPKALPALLAAMRTGDKVAAAGFSRPEVSKLLGVIDLLWQKLNKNAKLWEQGHAAESPKNPNMDLSEIIGELLLALATLSRILDCDAENALRDVVKDLADRFRQQEAANSSGVPNAKISEVWIWRSAN